ncbi:hypothetical protein ABZV58_03190 [Nocardia sp. NPDC004654]|uniref:hypothetical protein n=1 Tax=Nocardia sp. NPDC004654 TaxID=3154776 RepID=UPI0033AEAAB9
MGGNECGWAQRGGNRRPMWLNYLPRFGTYLLTSRVLVLRLSSLDVSWGSDTFLVDWRIVRKGDVVDISALWHNTRGGYESLLADRGDVTIDAEIFVDEWAKVLRRMVVDIEECDIDLENDNIFWRAKALVECWVKRGSADYSMPEYVAGISPKIPRNSAVCADSAQLRRRPDKPAPCISSPLHAFTGHRERPWRQAALERGRSGCRAFYGSKENAQAELYGQHFEPGGFARLEVDGKLHILRTA